MFFRVCIHANLICLLLIIFLIIYSKFYESKKTASKILVNIYSFSGFEVMGFVSSKIHKYIKEEEKISNFLGILLYYSTISYSLGYQLLPTFSFLVFLLLQSFVTLLICIKSFWLLNFSLYTELSEEFSSSDISWEIFLMFRNSKIIVKGSLAIGSVGAAVLYWENLGLKKEVKLLQDQTKVDAIIKTHNNYQIRDLEEKVKNCRINPHSNSCTSPVLPLPNQSISRHD